MEGFVKKMLKNIKKLWILDKPLIMLNGFYVKFHHFLIFRRGPRAGIESDKDFIALKIA